MKKNRKRWGVYNYVLKKTFRMMKLTLFCLLLGIIQVFASKSYSQQTRLSFKLQNAKVVEVLNEIENQTDFYFLYNQDLIEEERRVDVNFQEKEISEVLESLFENTNVSFSIEDRVVVLSASNNKYANQQEKDVSGSVKDSSGQPLPGVSIVIKGTTSGTITNFDGNFSLTNVPSDVTLVFSFVGMRAKEISVAEQSVFNITMEEDAIGIEEVVAVGYGTQKKINLTGSVSGIGTDEILSRPITNLSAGLSGLAPGVHTTQSTGGRAGEDGARIRIRGIGTFNDSNPLVVVDGIPSENTSILNDIDPNDIESISILKDASSAAIYGSRGANGVILVTTKRGEAGKPIFSYNAYTGWQKATTLPEFISDMALYMGCYD